MDIHKDCYSAIDLTQQDGPHRRETKLGAVFGILQIVLRLFHECPPVEEDVGDQKSGSIGTKLRFGQPDDYPFRLKAARRWRGGDDGGDHDRAITNKVYNSCW